MPLAVVPTAYRPASHAHCAWMAPSAGEQPAGWSLPGLPGGAESAGASARRWGLGKVKRSKVGWDRARSVQKGGISSAAVRFTCWDHGGHTATERMRLPPGATT